MPNKQKIFLTICALVFVNLLYTNCQASAPSCATDFGCRTSLASAIPTIGAPWSVYVADVSSPPSACKGGLVPCGRRCDDPDTEDINESKPCQFCHLFVLLDRIVDFLLVYVLFPAAVLMVVIVGVLYVSSVFEILPGGFQVLNQAKGIISSVIVGMVVIFTAFIIIGLFFKLIGLADWTTNFYQNWWSQGLFQINCQIK